MKCLTCGHKLKTMRRIHWQKEVCYNEDCRNYRVPCPDEEIPYEFDGIFEEGDMVFVKGVENLEDGLYRVGKPVKGFG